MPEDNIFEDIDLKKVGLAFIVLIAIVLGVYFIFFMQSVPIVEPECSPTKACDPGFECINSVCASVPDDNKAELDRIFEENLIVPSAINDIQFKDGIIWTVDEKKHIALALTEDKKLVHSIGKIEFSGNGRGLYQFYKLTGIDFDSDGKIYLADRVNNRVMVYTPDLKFFWEISANNEAHFNAAIYDIAVHEGKVIVPNNRRGTLIFHEWQDGNFVFTKEIPNFKLPYSVAFDSKGNYWVAETGANRVLKFSPTDEQLLAIEQDSQGNRLGSPKGVNVDSEDNVWVSDYFNQRVLTFDSEGNFIREIVYTADEEFYPYRVGIDEELEKIYAISQIRDTVWKFSFDGTFEEKWIEGKDIGTYLPESEPRDFAMDSEGNIYVTDDFAGQVIVLTPDYQIKGIVGKGVGAAPGYSQKPREACVDSKGNILVPEKINNRVQIFGPDYEFLKMLNSNGGSGEGQLLEPTNCEIFENKIYVVDNGNSRIAVFDAEYNWVENIPLIDQQGDPIKARTLRFHKEFAVVNNTAKQNIVVMDMQFNALRTMGGPGHESGQFDKVRVFDITENDLLYVIDLRGKQLQVFDFKTGKVVKSVGGNVENPPLFGPKSLIIDSLGNLLVGDEEANKIKVFDMETLEIINSIDLRKLRAA